MARAEISTHVVSTSPDIMGGTPVFPGTRVPVQTLLDYLEADDTIDEFLRLSHGDARACRGLP